jgi:plasmid stabilization system protein ParE
MRMHVSAAAQADIARIWTFYLAIDEKLAARAIKTIFDGLDILLKHAEIGRIVQDGMRALPIKFGQSGFLALYSYNPLIEEVVILRLRHQREQEFQP